MFSAIHSVVLVLAASAPAGLPQGSVGQAQVPKTLLSASSKPTKTQDGAVRFGPKGCVSTWLNDQARCMIKTECAEKEIDDYNFKFICVDESGEHVRHVFGKGSFDPEETFDTLVTCTSCTADADDLLVSAKQSKGGNDTKTTKAAGGPTSTNALLRQIVADVGELKVEMANATQNVERLNAAVFSSTVPPPAATATPAPETEFLAHRGTSALRTKVGSRARLHAINARAKTHASASKSHTHKIRRRHRDSEDDTADQEDAQGSTYTQEDQSQDDSQVQDDSQDQSDVHRRRDDVQQQQEDDDADGRDQADAGDADSDDEQRDDEHDQTRDDERSVDGDQEQDDEDRDADDDGRREENVD